MFEHSFVIFVRMSRVCHVCAPHIDMGYCTDAALTPHSASIMCVTNNTACCTRAATRRFVPVAVVCMRTPRQLCAGTVYKLSHSITDTCGTRHCNTLQHTATHCNTLQHTATHCTDTCGTRAHKLTHVYRQQCAGAV